MRLDDFFRLDTAIKRNIDLAGLLQTLEREEQFERKTIKSIRRRLHNLLAELGKLRNKWDEQLQGKHL
jgi:hypothetical protein